MYAQSNDFYDQQSLRVPPSGDSCYDDVCYRNLAGFVANGTWRAYCTCPRKAFSTTTCNNSDSGTEDEVYCRCGNHHPQEQSYYCCNQISINPRQTSICPSAQQNSCVKFQNKPSSCTPINHVYGLAWLKEINGTEMGPMNFKMDFEQINGDYDKISRGICNVNAPNECFKNTTDPSSNSVKVYPSEECSEDPCVARYKPKTTWKKQCSFLEDDCEINPMKFTEVRYQYGSSKCPRICKPKSVSSSEPNKCPNAHKKANHCSSPYETGSTGSREYETGGSTTKKKCHCRRKELEKKWSTTELKEASICPAGKESLSNVSKENGSVSSKKSKKLCACPPPQPPCKQDKPCPKLKKECNERTKKVCIKKSAHGSELKKCKSCHDEGRTATSYIFAQHNMNIARGRMPNCKDRLKCYAIPSTLYQGKSRRDNSPQCNKDQQICDRGQGRTEKCPNKSPDIKEILNNFMGKDSTDVTTKYLGGCVRGAQKANHYPNIYEGASTPSDEEAALLRSCRKVGKANSKWVLKPCDCKNGQSVPQHDEPSMCACKRSWQRQEDPALKPCELKNTTCAAREPPSISMCKNCKAKDEAAVKLCERNTVLEKKEGNLSNFLYDCQRDSLPGFLNCQTSCQKSVITSQTDLCKPARPLTSIMCQTQRSKCLCVAQTQCSEISSNGSQRPILKFLVCSSNGTLQQCGAYTQSQTEFCTPNGFEGLHTEPIKVCLNNLQPVSLSSNNQVQKICIEGQSEPSTQYCPRKNSKVCIACCVQTDPKQFEIVQCPIAKQPDSPSISAGTTQTESTPCSLASGTQTCTSVCIAQTETEEDRRKSTSSSQTESCSKTVGTSSESPSPPSSEIAATVEITVTKYKEISSSSGSSGSTASTDNVDPQYVFNDTIPRPCTSEVQRGPKLVQGSPKARSKHHLSNPQRTFPPLGCIAENCSGPIRKCYSSPHRPTKCVNMEVPHKPFCDLSAFKKIGNEELKLYPIKESSSPQEMGFALFNNEPISATVSCVQTDPPDSRRPCMDSRRSSGVSRDPCTMSRNSSVVSRDSSMMSKNSSVASRNSSMVSETETVSTRPISTAVNVNCPAMSKGTCYSLGTKREKKNKRIKNKASSCQLNEREPSPKRSTKNGTDDRCRRSSTKSMEEVRVLTTTSTEDTTVTKRRKSKRDGSARENARMWCKKHRCIFLEGSPALLGQARVRRSSTMLSYFRLLGKTEFFVLVIGMLCYYIYFTSTIPVHRSLFDQYSI